MEITETGLWVTKTPEHWFDQQLCRSIFSLLRKRDIRSLVDLGCGDGSYIKLISNSGIYCEGYDGNPHTMEVSSGVGKVLDLSEKIDLDRVFDCVLTLETGEHIPKEFEQTFLDNVTNHSNNLIIMSWAIPGQGGNGHFNEKENGYIINELLKRKFKINRDETMMLRKKATISWFKRTIMVFEYENNSIIND